MPQAEINYLAVLVAAVATFAIGALWYSPLVLGKAWMEAHGYTPDELERMRKTAARAYFLSFLCYLVMALVYAVLISLTAATTALSGLWLGFLLWLGFVATTGLTSHLFGRERPIAVYLIDAGFQLVYLLLMGVLLALWR